MFSASAKLLNFKLKHGIFAVREREDRNNKRDVYLTFLRSSLRYM